MDQSTGGMGLSKLGQMEEEDLELVQEQNTIDIVNSCMTPV